MNATANLTELIQDALRSPGNLVEMVDAILDVCLEQRLHLRWERDCCRVRSLRTQGGVEEIRKPLSKSQFRAVLARIAVLCNEHNPNSVSPYGGARTLPLGAKRNRAVRVLFVNTPDEQLLDIRPKRVSRVKLINYKLKPVCLSLQNAQAKIETLEERLAELPSYQAPIQSGEPCSQNFAETTVDFDATHPAQNHVLREIMKLSQSAERQVIRARIRHLTLSVIAGAMLVSLFILAFYGQDHWVVGTVAASSAALLLSLERTFARDLVAAKIDHQLLLATTLRVRLLIADLPTESLTPRQAMQFRDKIDAILRELTDDKLSRVSTEETSRRSTKRTRQNAPGP